MLLVMQLMDLSIVVYTDSLYRNDEQRDKSVDGKFIALYNQKGNCGPLMWKSKMTQRVCKSVKNIETQSLKKGLEDAFFNDTATTEIYTGKVSK